jgi:hypothetical protein
MPNQSQNSLERYIRKTSVYFIRSAYAVEVTPWTTKTDVEAALFLRGVIVSAHASIETRLAEACDRFAQFETAQETVKIPYSLKDKISYLQRFFRQPPFDSHKMTAERFFQRVLSGAELRHQIAHARMEVTDIRWGVDFYDFVTPKKMPTECRHLRLSVDVLEKEAWRAARLSRICQMLLGHLDSLSILPPFIPDDFNRRSKAAFEQSMQ